MTTENTKTPAIEQLATSMRTVCRKFDRFVCASMKNAEAVLVLIRALERRPTPTAEVLAQEWADELGDHPVDGETINMALELHHLFGPEWYIICMHLRMREENVGARGEGDEDFPLYGDDIQEVREMWEENFEAFDRKRAEQEEAARAWLKRQEMRRTLGEVA